MPGPVSDDPEHDAIARHLATDHDGATGRRVPDAVRHQVGEHLPDPDRVDVEDREITRDIGRDGHSGRACGARERPDDLHDEQVQVGRLPMERERAGLRQGHGAEVVDEPLHDPGLLEDRGQVRLVGRVDAVDHRLEVAGDDAEWRAKLVAHVVEQGAALVLVPLETFDHGVEAAHELTDRAPATGR